LGSQPFDYKTTALPPELSRPIGPLSRAEIKGISERWGKRTARSGTEWSKEGTFEVLCGEMEVMIKNDKPNDTAKKALTKRKRERIVLAMFEKEK
jgi:hypothetical protein